ncbi:MAG TPA: ABC transporter permease [Anaerolineales bacterium]|nr:ABC transporter permease [Anaerolineales bacterium]
MTDYIIRRVVYMFVVLFVVAGITFILMHSVPGGPFDKEKKLPPEIQANKEKYYHLDDPLHIQFFSYLSRVTIPRITTTPPTLQTDDDFLITLPIGDYWLKWMNFGPSYASRNRTVNDIFREQLPVSFQLGVLALMIAVTIGMPLGIISALNHNRWPDYASMGVAIFGVSVPTIVLGPLLVWIFGVLLQWLPPTGWGAKPPFVIGLFPSTWGWEYFKYAVLPAFVLGFGSSAVIARLTRASMLQVIHEDYIRTARAKGLNERLVVLRHALRNALIPVVTVLGPLSAALVTGTFVTELVFGIPGLGRYFVTSISNRDYPVIMGTILLYAVFLVISNLVVDILYALLDPRIRYS